MRRKEIPLMHGRTRVVDSCRNCAFEMTQIRSAAGQLLVWKHNLVAAQGSVSV